MHLTIANEADVQHHLALVRTSAARTREWISGHREDPLDLLRDLKFETVGFHPVEDRPLNFIEQINQTWTYAVALLAVRKLFELHPEITAYRVAPGAHMSQELDIMSEDVGLLGAETFAAVDPSNNRKLAKDLEKMSARSELHRYIFFASPRHHGTQRLTKLERAGTQVWSVDLHD
ncbi:hypothetical protein [Brevundimonas sp. DC300-4]|uniref:hypothetical protein n=1 Tax=Brevundimonas sp. DC300-4 TaxID=2804594 RepID=UPI003CEDB027